MNKNCILLKIIILQKKKEKKKWGKWKRKKKLKCKWRRWMWCSWIWYLTRPWWEHISAVEKYTDLEMRLLMLFLNKIKRWETERENSWSRLLLLFLFRFSVHTSIPQLEFKAVMASRYWMVSLPVHGSASSLWNRLQEQTSKHSFDTSLYRVLISSAKSSNLASFLWFYFFWFCFCFV